LKDKFVVTYAGALGMANDISTILQAAKQLRDHPEIHFVLVGDGKERQNLETIAREWDLANVTFTGVVRKSEIPQVLAASDACVATLKDIPMFRTTYPNKVFDYMAAGRPTLLAIDGVIREVVEAAQGGVFIPPGDAENLAESTLWLSQNRERASRMGEAARRYVEEHFNRSDHADQFVTLVRQFVG
jgi:glycosyltransferase involved in cell wall biosynthesis